MNLFRNKNDKSSMKLMGVHIPIEDANKISLYSLLQKTTRSKILKEMIDKFVEKLPQIEKLIQSVIKEIKKDFKGTKKEKDILKVNLSKKKIPQNIIEQIIKSLDQK